jgi:ATP-binding protein involved in chromosome partitioning
MTGDVFGSGGGQALADELDIPLLGQVPLDARLREQGDEGTPLVLAEPDSTTSCAIVAIAKSIAATKREEGIGIVKALPVLS